MKHGLPVQPSIPPGPLANGGWALPPEPGPGPTVAEPERVARALLAVTARAWGLATRPVDVRPPGAELS